MKFSRKSLFLVLAVGGAASGLGWWWQQQRLYPSTDDAYVQANVITISPQVGGQVAEVLVSENAHVVAGEALLRLDPALLESAVETAQAQLLIAGQNAAAAQSRVIAAQADVQAAQSARSEAETDYQRNQSLFDKGSIAQAGLDTAKAARDQADARLQSSQAALVVAQEQVGSDGAENAGVRAAQAAVTVAQINLDRAIITAPQSGWVANLSLRPGEIVSAGQPIFSVVEDDNWWVDANFKETDLSRIRIGQQVEIEIDMYPGLTLLGTVDSIGAGSGSVFALLPPQNASGNWVKVTQRFPVRIGIAELPTDPDQRLRVGASANARVDTTALTEAAK